jgi:hypothetical protein
VRCDDAEVADHIGGVLSRFRDRSGRGDRRLYEILDTGSDAPNARFRLMIDGRWVLGSGQVGHVLGDLYTHINLDAFEASPERVAIHAGALSTTGRVGMILPAPSGSGKTTLVAGLVRAGFGYLSDEAAVLDPLTATLEPYPVHLSLKAASQRRFPEWRPPDADVASSGGTWYVDPDAIRAGSVVPACPIGFVIAHRYEPGARLRVERLTPGEAMVELSRNLMLARRDASRSLELLARICQASTSYRITRGDLDEAVAAIADLTS